MIGALPQRLRGLPCDFPALYDSEYHQHVSSQDLLATWDNEMHVDIHI